MAVCHGMAKAWPVYQLPTGHENKTLMHIPVHEVSRQRREWKYFPEFSTK